MSFADPFGWTEKRKAESSAARRNIEASRNSTATSQMSPALSTQQLLAVSTDTVLGYDPVSRL